jgi:hypothetical protein
MAVLLYIRINDTPQHIRYTACTTTSNLHRMHSDTANNNDSAAETASSSPQPGRDTPEPISDVMASAPHPTGAVRQTACSSSAFHAGPPHSHPQHSRIPLQTKSRGLLLDFISSTSAPSPIYPSPIHINHNGRLQHLQDCAPPRHGRQHRLQRCQDLRQQDRRESQHFPSPSLTFNGMLVKMCAQDELALTFTLPTVPQGDLRCRPARED